MPSVKAAQAARFCDGVGVNTHLTYSHYRDIDRVLRCLDLLNVSHCRDLVFATKPEQWQNLKRVMNAGYKFCLMMTTDLGSLNEQLRLFASDPSGLSLLEGSNEDDISEHHRYDGNPDRRQPGNSGPGFPDGTRAWTRDLWRLAKGNDKLKHLGIVGPSLARGSSYPKLGDLSAWCDYGNSHSYFSNGDNPGKTRENNKAELKFIAPGRPLVATEAGYHTATGITSGNLGVSPEIHCIYMARFLFEQYQHGWKRSYIYELINKSDNKLGQREENWGLFYANGNPKPAALAIGAMLGVLNDPGAAIDHSTGSLDFTLSGMPGTGNHLLFQKKDGRFYLVLWNEIANWTAGKGGFRVGDAPFTLSVETPIRAVRYYRPAVDLKMSATTLDAGTRSWKLGLPDSPLIVEIVPQTVEFDPGPYVPDVSTNPGGTGPYIPDDTSNPGPGNNGGGTPLPNTPPPPPPPPPPVGDGSNNIVAIVSGDSFQGPARLAVLVDDDIIHETDVTAEKSSGQTQTVSLAAPVSLNGKSVGIRFTNDLWQPGLGDRSLWLHSVKIRGVEMLDSVYKMHSTATRKFNVPDNPGNAPGPVTKPPPIDLPPPVFVPPPEGAKSVTLTFDTSTGKTYAVFTVDGVVLHKVLMQQLG